MADRINTLPPTLRPGRRYLTFEVISDGPVEFSSVVNVIWSAVLTFLGERGTARAGLWIVKDMWDDRQQRGVVKCGHNAVEAVRAALALVTQTGDRRVILNILGVTGTLQSARAKFFGVRDLTTFGPK